MPFEKPNLVNLALTSVLIMMNLSATSLISSDAANDGFNPRNERIKI